MKLFFIFALGLCFISNSVFARQFIIGGEEVGETDPVRASTVGIYTPASGSLCTGTLIKRNIALTAAHCISSAKPVVIFNRDLHSHRINSKPASGVLVNPRWRKRSGSPMDQGDIALVKFEGGLPSGYKKISSVRSDSSIRTGSPVVLAGYGITNAKTHEGAGKLRKTEVRILQSRPGKSEMILDQSKGRGACHGDSGGPAFLRQKGKLVLAGVTNRGHPRGAPDDCGHQVVYTKVPSYRSWILKGEKKLEEIPEQNLVRKRKLRGVGKNKRTPPLRKGSPKRHAKRARKAAVAIR